MAIPHSAQNRAGKKVFSYFQLQATWVFT